MFPESSVCLPTANLPERAAGAGRRRWGVWWAQALRPSLRTVLWPRGRGGTPDEDQQLPVLLSPPQRPANPFDSWTSNGTAESATVLRPIMTAGQLQLFLLLFFFFFCFVILLFTSVCQTDKLPQHARELRLCRWRLRLTNVDTEGGHMETNHTSVQSYLASAIPRSSSIYRFTVTFCLKGECSRLYYTRSPRSR